MVWIGWLRTNMPPVTYYTHDNGTRPFKVEREGNHVRVLERSGGPSSAYDKLVLGKHCDTVLIGTSPLCSLTKASGAHGPEFDGNTVVIKPRDEPHHLFIGFGVVWAFRPAAPLVQLVSPVANGDLPYPYAVDADDRLYLFAERVVLEGVTLPVGGKGMKAKEGVEAKEDDPYSVFYARNYLNRFGSEGKELGEVRFGGRAVLLTTHTSASDLEDLERLLGRPVVVYADGTLEEVDRDDLFQELRQLSDRGGFRPLEFQVVHAGLAAS